MTRLRSSNSFVSFYVDETTKPKTRIRSTNKTKKNIARESTHFSLGNETNETNEQTLKRGNPSSSSASLCAAGSPYLRSGRGL